MLNKLINFDMFYEHINEFDENIFLFVKSRFNTVYLTVNVILDCFRHDIAEIIGLELKFISINQNYQLVHQQLKVKICATILFYRI